MKHLFYSLYFLLLMASCQGPAPDASVEVIAIDPGKTESIRRSELLSFREIIRPTGLKGEIHKIIPADSCFLIAGSELSLHDRNGQFLHSIGQKGNGPGEYLSVADVVIQDGLIRVLDRTGQKIVDYSLEGEFLKDYPLSFSGQAMALVEKRTLVYSGMDRNDFNHRLFLFDEDLGQFEASLGYDEKLHYLNLIEKTNFFAYNDSVRFLWAYDYNVYQAQEESKPVIRPRYRLDFGGHQIPEDFFHMPYANIMEFEVALLKTDYAGRIAGFYEDDHQLMFGFRFRERYLLGIYNKETRTTRVIDSVVDDILFSGSTLAVADEWFALHFHDRQAFLAMDSWQVAGRIQLLRESMTDTEWQQVLQENAILADLASHQDENSGPLVFLFDVKND